LALSRQKYFTFFKNEGCNNQQQYSVANGDNFTTESYLNVLVCKKPLAIPDLDLPKDGAIASKSVFIALNEK